jgi:hypothetical protein
MTRWLLGFAALCLIVWLGVRGWAKLPHFEPLAPDERDAILSRLRGGNASVPARAFAGPLFATLFDRGIAVTRVEGRGKTLAEATDAAARALAAAQVDPEVRKRGRVKVDVVMATAPLLTWPPLLATLAVVPGLDGVGLEAKGAQHYLLVDDLLRDDLSAVHAPSAGMEFTLGLDVTTTLGRLRTEAGVDRRTRQRFFRFRADEFVEPADHGARALPVTRGNTPGPRLSKEALREAALAGGHYLLGHLDANGRFDYEYWTARDQRITSGYSVPRHAGGAWFLSQLYGATHDKAFFDGATRAIDWLEHNAPKGCDGELRCIGDPQADRVDTGSAALAVVALTELEHATGDQKHDGWMRGLLAFLLHMQKDDGDFCHLYEPQKQHRDEQTKMLYYSGEAAFALAKLTTLARFAADQTVTHALDRALDYLTGAQYRQFALRFYFMEDHWTCMALDAGWDSLPADHRERYAKFCDQFIEFLGRTQFHAGEPVVAVQPDFLGAYGFSPLLPPHGTPVGSRSETAISTLHLQQRRGLPPSVTEVTRRQIMQGMQFLLDHQIRPDNAWLMADPDAAKGGFLMSDVARYVRIDFVQHACSAMLRASDLP